MKSRYEEILDSNLPEKLFIQMDNCWRENKNQFVFGYASYLVQQKVFKNVIINFFQVGHTHNDVDQLFSKVSQYLRSNNAITLDDLHQCVKNSTSSSPTLDCKHIENVPNISRMMQENNWLNSICGHTDPRVFQFEQTDKGVGILFKQNMRDSNFCNANGEPFILLREGCNLSANIPMGNYKGLTKQFLKEVDISLKACASRINSEFKLNTLKELVAKLRLNNSSVFEWNLELYNIVPSGKDVNEIQNFTDSNIECSECDSQSDINSMYMEANSVGTETMRKITMKE
jgi:hypothetical protein